MNKVIVMKTVSAEQHPNADSLRLYQFEAEDTKVQIVANLENVYEVGDLAVVALDGAILKDGTEISPVKLRGVPSYGMALGKVTDKEPGDDLSEFYCDTHTGPRLIKWPSIEHLHHICKGVKTMFAENTSKPPVVKYKAKVKLDGTNGGVQVFTDGRVIAQSHSRLLIDADNYGFAAWVKSNEEYFKLMAQEKHIVVFGEYCGIGIQKRCSISNIPRKIFTVFAMKVGGQYVYEPDEISKLVPRHEDVFVLPWVDGFEVEIDYGETKENIQSRAEAINNLVAEVERCDPWVKDNFGVEGLGEGVVLYPLNVPHFDFSGYMFKAKGEAHKTVKTKKSAQVSIEQIKGLDELMKLILTPARLEQGVEEACDGEFDIKKIGSFLKWVSADIQKECQLEMQEAGLEWKVVGKRISLEARDWYKAKALSF